MEEEKKVDGETLVAEGEGETPIETPTEEQVDLEDLKKKASAYEAQKVRAEKAERTLKKYMSMPAPEVESSVDSVALIKLGKKLKDFSEEELDFAVDFAKSKKPDDILKALENTYVQAGIQAQRQKVEKEKALKPSGTQSVSDKPKTLSEQLRDAPLSDKEEILKKMGLYKDFKPRADGRSIGR